MGFLTQTARLLLSPQGRARIRKAITWESVFGVAKPPSSGHLDIAENDRGWVAAYENHWAVRKCVDLRASLIASVPLKLVSRKKDGEIVEHPAHPAVKVLREPDPEARPGRSLIQQTETDLGVFGRAWWYVVRKPGQKNARGRYTGPPVRVYRLDPSKIDPRKIELYSSDRYGWIKRIEYAPDPDKAPHRYHFGQLVYFRYPSLWNDVDGCSRIAGIRHVVQASINATRWNAEWFRNGARLDGILETGPGLTDKQREDLHRQFTREYSGPDNVGKTIVLEGGQRYTAVGSSPRDADWIKMQYLTTAMIADAFDVPLRLLAVSDQQAVQDAWENFTLFWVMALMPEMEKLASILNHRFIRMWGDTAGMEWVFDLSDVPALRRDRLTRTSELTKGVGGPFLVPDEAREATGLPPLPGGKGKKLNSPYRYQLQYKPGSGKRTGEEPAPDDPEKPSD